MKNLPFFLVFLHYVHANCPLHRPTQFLHCYTVIPETPAFWLYAIIFILVFFSTILGLKMYACLKIGWIHPREDLSRFPLSNFQLQPPPPAPLPRTPSIISYFNLAGEDE